MKKTIVIILAIIFITQLSFSMAQSSDEGIIRPVWNTQTGLPYIVTKKAIYVFDNLFVLENRIALDELIPDTFDGQARLDGLGWNVTGSSIVITLAAEGNDENYVYGNYNFIKVFDTQTWKVVFEKTTYDTFLAPVFKANSENLLTIFDYEHNFSYIRNYDIKDKLPVEDVYVTRGLLNFGWNPKDDNNVFVGLKTLLLIDLSKTDNVHSINDYNGDEGVAYNPNGDKIAFVNFDYQVKIFDVELLSEVATIDIGEDLFSFQWIGEDILLRMEDRSIHIWNHVTQHITPLEIPMGWYTAKYDGTMYASNDENTVVFYAGLEGENIVGQYVFAESSQVSSVSFAHNDLQQLVGLSPIVFQDSGTLQANLNGHTTTSVHFSLNGISTIDNQAPYTIPLPPVGSYTLTATPYSLPDAEGDAGIPLTIEFEVVD